LLAAMPAAAAIVTAVCMVAAVMPAAASLEIVAAARDAAVEPVRKSWAVDCEHGLEPLAKRIPMTLMGALSRPAPERTPIFLPKNFRTLRRCFVPQCFRAVVDDFATEAETQALWTSLEPKYERPTFNASGLRSPRGEHADGAHFISVTADMFPAGLLENITSRMAAYLETEHGAKRLYVSHTNSRGEWRFKSDLASGHEEAARRQAKLRQGDPVMVTGHIDAARPTNWHYTCLLYMGEHERDRFAGGETLIIDRARTGDDGGVTAGLCSWSLAAGVCSLSAVARKMCILLSERHMAIEVSYRSGLGAVTGRAKRRGLEIQLQQR